MVLDEQEWRLMWMIKISFTHVHLTVAPTKDLCSASSLKQYFYYPACTRKLMKTKMEIVEITYVHKMILSTESTYIFDL